ncbi:unnamed protein product [Gongylonema pulchrum]|uniref:ZM domain-containing protein n=1 Tax=Gongylonema pulchrum TaxID=637853 RepID=A0A183EN85_9BILA|nr:unnamed protein product [Gongylonema pulchrum]
MGPTSRERFESVSPSQRSIVLSEATAPYFPSQSQQFHGFQVPEQVCDSQKFYSRKDSESDGTSVMFDNLCTVIQSSLKVQPAKYYFSQPQQPNEPVIPQQLSESVVPQQARELQQFYSVENGKVEQVAFKKHGELSTAAQLSQEQLTRYRTSELPRLHDPLVPQQLYDTQQFYNPKSSEIGQATFLMGKEPGTIAQLSPQKQLARYHPSEQLQLHDPQQASNPEGGEAGQEAFMMDEGLSIVAELSPQEQLARYHPPEQPQLHDLQQYYNPESGEAEQEAFTRHNDPSIVGQLS